MKVERNKQAEHYLQWMSRYADHNGDAVAKSRADAIDGFTTALRMTGYKVEINKANHYRVYKEVEKK